MEPSDPIAARIERDAGLPGLVDVLAERLAPTDLQSLLLAVTRRRSRRRTPAQLVAALERDAAVRASDVDGRALHALQQVALDAAPAFDAVELAPVAPVGVNVVLGQVDQNNALATVRGSEVLADPTTAQALEAARRRRAARDGTVRLCSNARILRLQPFEGEGMTQHFALFALASAGRAAAGDGFELEALREHATAYLGLLRGAAAHGYAFADAAFSVCDTLLAREAQARGAASGAIEDAGALAGLVEGRAGRAAVARLARVQDEVFPALRGAFPEARFELRLDRDFGLTYYDGLALQLHVTSPGGRRLGIADGGCTDWTRRLLSDGKERMLVSAIGLEVAVRLFRA